MVEVGRTYRLNGKLVTEEVRPVGFCMPDVPESDPEQTEQVEKIVKQAVEQYREAFEKLADE